MLYRHIYMLYRRMYMPHWKLNHDFSLSEHETRFMIFEKNLAKIDLLNRLEQGTAKYGVTKFADLTRKLFQALWLP